MEGHAVDLGVGATVAGKEWHPEVPGGLRPLILRTQKGGRNCDPP